jgi:hypothetical protein
MLPQEQRGLIPHFRLQENRNRLSAPGTRNDNDGLVYHIKRTGTGGAPALGVASHFTN